MERAVKLGIVLPVAAIVIFLIIIFSNSLSTQKHATEIVDDLRSMDDGNDPAKKFELIRRKYRNEIKRSEPCTSEHCFYEIEINNRVVAALHLASYAQITTDFQFDRESLSFTITEYRLGLRNGISPVVHVQEDNCQGNCPDWFRLGVNPHGRRSTDLSNGMVEFNGNATKEERAAARSFNFRCLSAFATCKDITDLLPGMWERNPDGSVRCRFRTSSDAYDDWR